MTPGWCEFGTAKLGAGVEIGQGTVLGQLARATAANRRPIVQAESDGVAIGDGTVIGCNCVIYRGVAIGPDCRVGDLVVIREGVTVGARSVIGTMVDVQYDCRIGDDVQIMNLSHITGGTIIGNNTFIGPRFTSANDLSVNPYDYKFPPLGLMPPRIGSHVLIGMDVTVFPGVTIGDGARIGGGARVARNVAAGQTVWPVLTRKVPVPDAA